jgi:hypothetical protein
MQIVFFSPLEHFALVEQVVGFSCCTIADYRILVSFKPGM